MRWVEWSDGKCKYMHDARWMVKAVYRMLREYASKTVHMSEEIYLKPPSGKDYADRSIAMAAFLECPVPVMGVKWISSKASLTKEGKRRGRAVTVLNDGITGYPLLAFESTVLSIARTAAVACAALEMLLPNGVGSALLIGCGQIHEMQANYMRQLWPNVALTVYDVDVKKAMAFGEKVGGLSYASFDEAMDVPNQVVSIAVAGAPNDWMGNPDLGHSRVWIDTSLRDVEPAFLRKFKTVICDDIHLADVGDTSFARALAAGLLNNTVVNMARLLDEESRDITLELPAFVSPMGLSMFDVGIGWRLFSEEFEQEFWLVRQ